MSDKEIKVELPDEVKFLFASDIFELEQVDDQKLQKYLFYVPEVMRIFGMVVAENKRRKRQVELEIFRIENIDLKQVESEVILEISRAIDSQRYRNEQMRTAKIVADPRYVGVIERIIAKKGALADIETEIDQHQEYVWKWKNLLQSLDNISKLRVSERRY
jgi:hypothetical protein